MQLNKTFLLTAIASHTEGSMLLVIDSLDEFVKLFKQYHTKKRDLLMGQVPEYFSRAKGIPAAAAWGAICERHQKCEIQFVTENNSKPFNFEFDTGCHYIEKGKGEGNFYDDVVITTDPKRDDCWFMLKEFLSDLPRGTHYLGDYCS